MLRPLPTLDARGHIVKRQSMTTRLVGRPLQQLTWTTAANVVGREHNVRGIRTRALLGTVAGRGATRRWSKPPGCSATRRHLSHGHGASSHPQTEQTRTIAVLGGGLSGLTTTLYLSRLLPQHRIILWETSDHLGGWVRSEKVHLPGSQGDAVLEAGPRSIRPKGAAGWRMIEMIHSLNLMDRVIVVPKTALSAKNRYIYFSSQLNKLPSSLLGMLGALFRLPLLRSLLPTAVAGLLGEPFRPSQFARPKSESKEEVARQRKREFLLDESIESFIRRRFGNRFGGRLLDNMLSAVLHGIYAADARQLSVRSTLPILWQTEQRHGSLLRAALPTRWNRRYRPPTPVDEVNERDAADAVKQSQTAVGPEWSSRFEQASVFGLKGGLGDITEALVHELRGKRNVSFRLNESVELIQESRDGAHLFLRTSAGEDVPVSRLVSSAPSSRFAQLLDTRTKGEEQGATCLSISASCLSILRHNPSTTVGSVSFAIPPSALPEAQRRGRMLKTEEAFGFLIPRAENARNKAGILGVVFDSDAIPDQDDMLTCGGRATKLTVMMGGPHLKGKAAPTEAECQEHAVAALEDYLDIPRSVTTHPDTAVRSRVQRACIPTYLPGHFSRMWTLHRELASLAGGRIAVTGASYTGVSVNDVVHHARSAAERIAAREQGGSGAVTATGLESFASH
ncbi:unnamed protein product [Parajaminaea phylloscopi]